MKLRLIFLLTTLTLLCGCSKSGNISDYDKVHNHLMALESYTADTEICYISNKGENTYTAKQYAQADGRYRLETTSPEEYNGCVLLFDGKMIWQYNPSAGDNKIKVNAPDKPERAELILFNFMENYVKSKDVGIETSSVDESLCTVLEAKIPGDNKFLSTEKLWIDNQTLAPKKLVIYDCDSKEKVVVNYNNFEYNCEIEQSKFALQN